MSSQNSIRVLTIEPAGSEPSLKAFLSNVPGFDLGAEASRASEALQRLQSISADVVVLDLADKEGIALIRSIRQTQPNVRVVIVTASDSPEDIFAAMDAGADGYVLKGNVTSVLEVAVRSARLGAVWLDPGIAKQVLHVIETATPKDDSRILPTGVLRLPLLPNEKSLLTDVAESSCTDGVCMVDPSFIKKLKRFSATAV